jgi:DNA-binding response OmpR family regulator
MRSFGMVPPRSKWNEAAILRRRATRSLRSGYGLHLLEFRILGPLEVVREDGPVRLGSGKQRAMLAVLLLNANRVVSVDRLAEDLYGDEPPATVLTQI